MDRTILTYFDQLYSNLVGLYYFNGVLDISKLQESLDKTIADIPVLSSIIVKDGEDHFFQHVSPSNVKIGVKEDVEDSLYNAYQPNEEGILKYEDGHQYYKYFESITTKPNVMEPVLEVPVLKVTLLLTKETKKSILVISINHAVADAHSLTYFMSRWSEGENFKDFEKFEINRFEVLLPRTKEEVGDIEKDTDPSILERTRLYHPFKECPKEEIGLRLCTNDKCIQKVIVFKKQRLQELKGLVKNEGKKFSSNDCVSAMMWKIYSAIGSLTFKPETVIPFQLVINFRNRVPNIQTNYFGNAVVTLNLDMTQKQIIETDFSDIVMKIRGLINSTNGETVQSIVDCIKEYKSIWHTLWRKPTVTVDDWRLVDAKKPSNFGCGEDVKCERTFLNPPAAPYFVPGMYFVNLSEEGDILVTASFENEEYEILKKYDLSSLESVEKILEEVKNLKKEE